MAHINDFVAHMTGGGARANQFQVFLNFPGDLANHKTTSKSMFLCKTASLPSSTIENIAVPYRGRMVNFAGERTFETWEVTIINDTDFVTHKALMEWMRRVQNFAQSNGAVTPQDYYQTLRVQQLGRNGEPLLTYNFVDAYPTLVGSIPLDYSTGDTIEEFTCTFTYNYYEYDDAAELYNPYQN